MGDALSRKDGFVYRVAIGTVSGPNTPVLRVWTTRGSSDVYVSFREIAGSVKISLHESGQCHSGLTSQAAANERELVEATGGSRHQHEWTRRTHLGSKSAAALYVCFPHSELRSWRTKPITESSVVWLTPPSIGKSIVISCVYTGGVRADADWPGQRNGLEFLAAAKLPNGEKFWLVSQELVTTPIEQHIIREVRRRLENEKLQRFKNGFDGEGIGPRVTAFGHDPNLEGYIVVDVATNAESPSSE